LNPRHNRETLPLGYSDTQKFEIISVYLIPIEVIETVKECSALHTKATILPQDNYIISL